MTLTRCTCPGRECPWHSLEGALSFERAMCIRLTTDMAAELSTIVVTWNRDRQSRGMPPLTEREVLVQVLRIVREDVIAGKETPK